MTLPNSFTEYTRNLLGDALYAKLAEGMASEPPVSIRINKAKCQGHPVGGDRVAWCPSGYYIDTRPAFTFDPLLHAGWYYVQEASSMFLHHILDTYATGPTTMLDLCAAPGGKSTVALGALPRGSALVCNEPVRPRANVLAENMAKWGLPEVIVTNSTHSDFARSGLQFDIILCDVPCSGEGMFRKDRASIGEWSPQGVARCAALQRKIVDSAWQCLRPGGLLIYSTCTLNAIENEENVAWMCSELGAELMEADTAPEWNITGSLADCVQGPVYRFLPGITRGEGLFMAVMRKDGESETTNVTPRCRQRPTNVPEGCRHAKEWIAGNDSFAFTGIGDCLAGVPTSMATLLYEAMQTLNVVQAGVTVAQMRGGEAIPTQHLALSAALRREAFPTVEVGYREAIAYLRREPVTLPAGTPRGYVLLTYGGTPLGFEKNLCTRANNLYPQEWRIKSTHVPDEASRPHVIDTTPDGTQRQDAQR